MPRVSTGRSSRILFSRFCKLRFPPREMGWLWQSCCGDKGLTNKKRGYHPNTTSQWVRLCKLRLRNIPLQYLIGWQPFGSLKILCRKHVLIPRWETEEWVSDLGKSILENSRNKQIPSQMNLVDFCTGSGCIPLLLLKMTNHTDIFKQVMAVDISPYALKLTQRNLLNNNLHKNSKFQLQYGNILKGGIRRLSPGDKIDILTCNPPYISSETFETDVEDSVKKYEPHLALIGDLEFYENLIKVWLPRLNSFVYELGSYEQFNYVKSKIILHNNNHPTDKWGLGIKFDSNGQLRCVFGFKSKLKSIFQDYGQLIIQV